MNKTKWMYLLYWIPFVFFVGWVVYLSCLVANGQTVIVRIYGYDPRDLFSGHYLQYQIDWDKTDCSQFKENNCPYSVFKKVNRFYLPKMAAKRIDRLLARNLHEKKNKFEIVFSYREGAQPVAEQLLIDGKDWQEFLIK